MNESYLYLAVDVACLIVPFFAAFHRRYPFNREWRSVLSSLGITATVFIAWDMLFTYLGIWEFNPRYILGIYFNNLPIEEVAFFLCIPYPCLFIFYCIDKYLKPKPSIVTDAAVSLLIILFLVFAAANIERIYTSCTFLLLSLLLILLFSSREIAASFLLSFCIALLPFFISNGILTGLWTHEPVVIYNDRYNLNIRMLTIPIEDLFYGMAFQLMNVLLFHRFRKAKLGPVLRP